MSKGIFLVFCVAVLFSSGLAAPQEAEVIPDEPAEVIEPVEPAETIETIEPAETIEPVEPAETIEPIVEETAVEAKANENGETQIDWGKIGTKAIGAVIDVVGGVSKAGSKAGAGNKKYNNQGNNQGNAQALSGGNTVQIPTIFFMVLAIFNN